WPDLPEHADDLERFAPWILPPVYARLTAGHGDFIAELRPVTALFARFSGIDYDDDPDALGTLDRFTRAVQSVLSDYEGTLIQLTIGDKGSYLYAACGAPIAHEDDAARALLAALDLRALAGAGQPIDEMSIGVATGRLRAGAYGGSERRSYGVLGDTVNLAARLMQSAGPRGILATRAGREAPGSRCTRAGPRPLTGKGKAAPIRGDPFD